MGKVIVDISMSVDGLATASGVSAEQPLGAGGERLHSWFFGDDDRNQEAHGNAVGEVGAIIAGRRTYDLSVPWWGPDGPSGPRRIPVFVVTHSAPEDAPEGSVYTFVSSGIDQALQRARRAADGRDVAVMGGADIVQQYLRAGLVDELSIHQVPVLLGGGTPLFDEHGGARLELETVDVIATTDATHLRFRVLDGRH
ncbi:MAG: dihydrofolate reductase family protein [Actinomycetota bacterium]